MDLLELSVNGFPRKAIQGVWLRGLGTVALILVLWFGYRLTARPVTLVIDNQTYDFTLHSRTVGAVLQELGLALEPEDMVQPLPETQISAGATITVQLARPVIVEADGRVRQRLTHQRTVAGVLAEAGVVANPNDEILVDGQAAASIEAVLPPRQPKPPSLSGNAASFLFTAPIPGSVVKVARPETTRLIIHRAMPVTLNDGRLQTIFYTTQPNVGEALLEQDITLFLGDKVTPSLGTRLSPGLGIFIERSVPVAIVADGRTIQTRTRRETVGELLAQEEVALMGQDFSRPPLDDPVAAGDLLEVVRVRETIEIEQEVIDFETEWVADETLELDQQEIRQTGATGVIKTRTRVRYENGQQVWRQVEDEWLDQEPQNRVIAYGTQIVVRTLQTENGPLEYWRKIPMLATAYSAATSGKAPDHPRYGITRSGLQAGYGVVAVDPSVIPLMTNLYIPEYGLAVAGDTGGRVLGKHIDLGFDDDQSLPVIYEWRDVYVLTPAPPADHIRYVLPQWPQR